MENGESEPQGYVVPRYRAEGHPAWYHALHGAIPGYQLDFMYCPDAPQGPVTRTHINHLSRVMKYIEPRHGAPFAFALANLSRNDVEYEPGHGGLGVIFALRVTGVVDHMERPNPSYSHGAITADRRLDYATLLEAIGVLYRRFLETDEQGENTTGGFYRAYYELKQKQQKQNQPPEIVEAFLHDYIIHFDELPQPQRSHLGLEWEASEENVPKLVTIVHADDEPFENIAHAAAMLGAMLYKSNIKWTTITTGREAEIPGGTWIRFVPASEAPREGRALSPREARKTAAQDLRMLAARDPKGMQVSLKDLPEDEAALAHLMFGAKAPGGDERGPRAPRPDTRDAGRHEEAVATGSHSPPGPPRLSNRPPPTQSTPPVAPNSSSVDSQDVDFDEAATLQAPLEADPAPAPAPAPLPVQAFDLRRSSPTTGVPSAFDPRRSSPTTGVATVGMVSVKTGAASPILAPAPSGNPVIASAAVPISPRIDSPPPPALESGPRSALGSDPQPASRSRLGTWIGVGGGLVVIVAIVVAVVTGGGEGSTPPAGGPDARPTGEAAPVPTLTAAPPRIPSAEVAPLGGPTGSSGPSTAMPNSNMPVSSSAPTPSASQPPNTATSPSWKPPRTPKPRKPPTILDKPL